MSASPVRAWETTLALDTYPIGPPDPFPPYQLMGNASVYPYPLLDTLSMEKERREYRALMLENRYLQVTVLPELGGRIYRVFDKISQRDMFYTTRVIKPALIALRGAWIAGGIEWNFRKGHHVDTLSPVSGWIAQNDDGSASIIVGHPEWVSHMRWQVRITLRPDDAAIYVDIRLSNPTRIAHRYYFWSNSAEAATDGLQIICPASSGWGSRGNRFRWPVHEGRDLQWYRNIPGSSDAFLYAPHRDFFGCYDHDAHYGLVHFADARRAPGKKFFTWGVDEHGRMWAEILSDGDGPYVELQASPQLDQHVWDMFPPQTIHAWNERWWPVRAIGGVAWANDRAAVNLQATNGRVQVGICPSRPLGRCRITLQDGDRILWEIHADLAPERPFTTSVELPLDASARERLSVHVTDASGEMIIAYDPKVHTPDVPLPPERPRPPRASMTAEELTVAARVKETEAEYDEARDLLREALSRDPGFSAAHVGLARLSARQGLWRNVLEHTEQALKRDPHHGEAIYLSGLAHAALGDDEVAETTLWQLHRDPAWATPAFVALGDLAARAGRWSEAIELYEQAASPLTGSRLSLAFRRLGRTESALRHSRAAVERDRCDGAAWAEVWFATRETADFDALRAALMDQPEMWLDVALFYADLGATDEALELLSWATDEGHPAADHPIARYHLARLQDRAGDRAAAGQALRRARRLPPAEIFPHRLSTLDALDYALAHDPADARAHLYRGEILYALGRRPEAEEAWRAAVRHEPGLAVAHRNLGLAAYQAGRHEEALRHYEEAVRLAPDQVRPHLERDRVGREAGVEPRQRLDWLRRVPASVRADHRVALQLAHLHTLVGEYDAAIDLLESTWFHPW